MGYRMISDWVWLIGSGTDPDALTDPHDCHAYLIDGGTGAAIVDCGTGIASDGLVANITQVGLLERVETILVTHYHADHAGGVADLHRATGAQVLAASEVAAALAEADEQATQVDAARTAGVYPADYRYPRFAGARTISDGAMIRVGEVEVTAHAAPGHCDGHLCYLAEREGQRALFSGDAVFAAGRVSIQPIPDCRPHVYGRTCQSLARLAPDILLPGHGELELHDGSRPLNEALAYFERLTIPPNLGR